MISRVFCTIFSFLALSALILHILGSDLNRGCQNAINKVLRRRVIAKKYPKYSWNKNFGYGTSSHLKGLKKYGVTKHHRKKFKPIHNILMKKTRETQ